MSYAPRALRRFTVVLAVLGAATTVEAQAGRKEHKPHAEKQEASMQLSQIRIPESMRLEHEEIHGALVRATKLSGRVGEAARALAAVLHPHFVREEEIALPPLGLLAPLARGEPAADMRDVLPMTDALRAELPRMLEEHEAIRAATLRLAEVARAGRDAKVVDLTEKLALHAQSEEELFYPAALLVGELVRARSSAMAAP